MIQQLNEIDYKTNEGRLLMAAIAIITTELRTDKTPDEVISELNQRANNMFQVTKLKIETYPDK